jgi:hypothetical protein
MSVKIVQIQDVRNLQAFSTDAVSVPADGSTLHLVDTGEQLVAHDGAWIPDQRLAWGLKLLQIKLTM